MHFRPNLLGDSQNLGEGLATVFAVLPENLSVLEASERHAAKGLNILGELRTQLPIFSEIF
jgi:hypothetical protein